MTLTWDFSDRDVLFYANVSIACRAQFVLPMKQCELVERLSRP